MPVCPNCGVSTAPGAYCGQCGRPLTTPTLAPPPMVAAAGVGAQRERPAGVTLLAILAFVAAGAIIVGSFVAFMAVTVMGAAFGAAFRGWPFFEWVGVLGSAFAVILAMMLLMAMLVGAILIVEGVGLMRGSAWAWPVGIALAALLGLNALADVASGDLGSVLPLVVAGGAIWYFFTPDVKQYFGRT